MTDASENLVLEHLRHIRGEIGALRGEVRDQRDRLSSIEGHVVGLRRDQAESMASVALIHGRLDRFNDRLERIEQRLGLVDA